MNHEQGRQDSLRREALALHQSGRLVDAEKAYLALLAQWPDDAETLHLLGSLLASSGRVEAGIARIDEAIALQPGQAVYHFNRGTLLLRHGQAEAAAASFREAIRLQPGAVASYINLAAACRQQGLYEEAVARLEQALAMQPAIPGIHQNLANNLFDLGRCDEAVEHYDIALQQQPDSIDIRMSLGQNLCAQGQYEQAIQHFRQALSRAPGQAAICLQLAHALKAIGRLDEAVTYFRKALEIDPRLTEAHQALANIVRHDSDDQDIAAMEALLASDEPAAQDRIHLNFALGKAYADCADHRRSFACFSEGNRLKRRSLVYDPAATEAEFERIRQAFSRPLPALTEAVPADGPRMIFIVGMPRSGTSLIEQILASHPDVFGVGESPWLARSIDEVLANEGNGASTTPVFPEGLWQLQPAALAEIASRYLARLCRQASDAGAEDASVLTDKMPHNFRLLGLIAQLFPDAVILHTRRHPLDVCLSCFQQNFVADHPYSYDLLELGHYYLAYERLMAFWQRLLPGRICDIDYQGLVTDQQAGIRHLLEQSGLAWDPRCLDFHRTDRAVATASDAQVRQPIYRSSVERWRHYEEQLRPLRTLLTEQGLLPKD